MSFEQGRPLIEALRRTHPEYQILLSFFSPSGYTVRHDYAGADVVVYLPSDRQPSVDRFLELAHPSLVVIVKYDFWPTMLYALAKRGIPTYLVSAIFRREQLFFRPWGDGICVFSDSSSFSSFRMSPLGVSWRSMVSRL